MSYATIVAVCPDEQRTHPLEDLRNSHGFAPPIWEVFNQEYFHGGKYYLAGIPGDDYWALGYDERIPAADRAVFRMTFDTHYVRARDFAKAANDIREFLVRHSWEGCNHWPRIASMFDNPPLRFIDALGFIGTNVIGENPWEWNVSWSGRCKKECGECPRCRKPFDWSTAVSVYD